MTEGYYALSKTLQMKPGQTLLGVSRIYSNLVPHSSVKFTIQPGEKPMPLLRTATGAADRATIGMLSVLVDGKAEVEWEDPAPLRGNGYVGLRQMLDTGSSLYTHFEVVGA